MKFGKKGRPFYRIVAIDKRKKRDGSYIEKVGHYDPMIYPELIELNKPRINYWLDCGAEISQGLSKLFKKINFKKD
jgi:small subunit ribosomal protein S16